MFWRDSHVCNPLYECSVFDLRTETGVQIHASSAEDAAERYAVNTMYDGASDVTEVFVRDGDRVIRFAVSIEMQPVATAVEKESFDDSDEEE
ncbi:MAG: hypothetical protein IAE79_07700 [Anaerolinea sp.]|nr:hypothetical protein [Anaerolinea sp.]